LETLIALPLAKLPRQLGNTLFVDTRMEPFDDQWKYLSSLPRLGREDLERILSRIVPLAPLTFSAQSDRASDQDLALQSDAAVLDLSHPSIQSGMLTGETTIRLDAQIHVFSLLTGTSAGQIAPVGDISESGLS